MPKLIEVEIEQTERFVGTPDHSTMRAAVAHLVGRMDAVILSQVMFDDERDLEIRVSCDDMTPEQIAQLPEALRLVIAKATELGWLTAAVPA